MTRKKWLKYHDPWPMYQFVRRQIAARKQRLFFVGCCQLIRHLITDPECRNAVDAAELFADGQIDEATLAVARSEVARLLTTIELAQRLPLAPSRSDGTRMWAASAALAAAESPDELNEGINPSAGKSAVNAVSYDV